jgi:hypothetical protein
MTDYCSFVYSGFTSSGMSGDACKNRGNWSLMRSAEVVDDQPEKEKWDPRKHDPEQKVLLFYTHVSLMAVILIMASSRKVMGKLVIPPYLKAMGWLATVVMLCACIGVFFTWQ